MNIIQHFGTFLIAKIKQINGMTMDIPNYFKKKIYLFRLAP